MAGLRELRARTKSINSTEKTTRIQELITTLCTIKAQRRVANFQPYAGRTKKVTGRLVSASSLDHLVLVKCEGNQRAAVLIVASDRGMCGGYNRSVLKKAAKLCIALKEQGYGVVLYVTGRKGADYYDFHGIELAGTWEDFSQDPDYVATRNMCRHLIGSFNAMVESAAKYREDPRGTNGEAVQNFDQVRVVYTEFVSVLSQIPHAHQMFLIEPVYEDVEIVQDKNMLSDGPDDLKLDYEFEPDTDTLPAEFLPQHVSCILFAVILEVAVSEPAAHRNAMKSATDDAIELVKDLPCVANQARQVQIIQEITKTVSGTGALDDNGESDQVWAQL